MCEMKYNPPETVELLQDESNWYKSIPTVAKNIEEWQSIADTMELLMKSLLKRNAIPEIRLRVFSNPSFAETWNKSPKQIFESNGTSGDNIYRDPHFIKYLHYFIKGPDLPSDVIIGFCKILNDNMGTSGMILNDIRKYVRSCIRSFFLDRISAASEFYRLCVELNTKFDPHSIRKAAMSTR